MVKVKKYSGGGDGAPRLDILAARIKFLECELTLEETEVKPTNGRPFIADPNFNCKFQVVQNLVEPGVHEGAVFYDRFKLKQDEDGDWAFAKYSKLGNVITVRYGPEWHEDPDAEFIEEDFDDFEMVAQLEPKTDAKGNALPGTSINWKSMRPVGAADVTDSAA
jgi:hypothetical protein